MTTPAINTLLGEIAAIIDPAAMNGTSANGRLDQADAYDKAEDIFNVMSEFFSETVQEEFAKEAGSDGHVVVDKDQMKVLRQVAKTNKKIRELVDDLKHSKLDEYIENTDFIYEVEFEEKRYRNL